MHRCVPQYLVTSGVEKQRKVSILETAAMILVWSPMANAKQLSDIIEASH